MKKFQSLPLILPKTLLTINNVIYDVDGFMELVDYNVNVQKLQNFMINPKVCDDFLYNCHFMVLSHVPELV